MKTRKIATKLTPRISEFVSQKSGWNYREDECVYFHYPNYKDFKGFEWGEHLNNEKVEGYQELTEQDFINYFNDNETMKTKFIDVSGTSKPEKKETVFTHYHHEDLGFCITQMKPKDYKEIYYLGEITCIGSLFKAISEKGYSVLFKGIKGDEFNS